MNYSDAARIKAVLSNCGWSYVETIDEADIVIFDTCSVRQKSEDKVTGKLKEIPRDKKIWITGCMVQHNFRNKAINNALQNKKITWLMDAWNFVGNVVSRNPDVLGVSTEEMNEKLSKVKQMIGNIVYINHAFNPLFFELQKKHPHIELFFRIDDTWFLPLMLQKIWHDVTYDAEVVNEYTSIIPQWANQLFQKNTKTAYVPISTWCSQFCAFCIVPYARGLEKHLEPDQIVTEVKHHLDNGIEEIVLLGQIVNKHPQFVEICQRILALPQLKWLRYTSPYPTHYSDELLALHENEPKMCPHIHMPLQSGSDAVLKKMFRWYTVEEFTEFVDKIRWLKRHISLTTDIIVGFTDETEEDFQQTLDLTTYARFDMIYIGIYSVRPWTYAARHYEDNVPQKEKKQRRSRLNDLLTGISIENNREDHGRVVDVMVKNVDEDKGLVYGYTDSMKNIVIHDAPDVEVADWLRVEVTDSEAFKLSWKVKQ